MQNLRLNPSMGSVKSFCTTACRVAAIIFAILGSGTSLSTQTGAAQWATGYELKAAFVHNIMPFVDWPSGSFGDRVIIGFAGEGPMASVMAKSFSGKRIGSRLVEVRDVHSQSELRACNVLLLAFPDRSRMRETLVQLHGTNVLTIGEGEQFTKFGGIIAFVPRDNTFQLAINLQAAERAHLKISSKLMKIAKLISDDETGARY